MQTAKPQSQPIHPHTLTFAPGAIISADAVLKGNIVVGEGKRSLGPGFKANVAEFPSCRIGCVLHPFCQILAHRGTITIGPNCDVQEDAIIEC